MREEEKSHQTSVSTHLDSSFEITTPEDGENAPLILGITNSSVVQSTLTVYLLDLGYRVAGPFDSVTSATQILDKNNPDIIVFDVTSNKEELNTLILLLKLDRKSIPILLISNEEIHINHPYQNKIGLPLNPHELAESISFLHKNQKAYNTPVHKLLNFINRLFTTLIQIAPNNYRPIIEKSINKTIFNFCNSNHDFSRISEESLSIILKDASFINISDFIDSLQICVDELISDLNSKFDSKIGSSLINDAIESIILSKTTFPTYIRELISKLGVDPTKFLNFIDSIIPKLDDHEKSCFVAFLTMGDQGPELVTHVTNNDQISQGLNDGVASQIITLVGQGSSYHQGVFGPIPVPTSNNIVAMIWSRVMGSNIKDPRMDGRGLSVVVIGFYRELVTYLPKHETIKSIFGLLDSISHINEVSKELLMNIQEKFIDSFS